MRRFVGLAVVVVTLATAFPAHAQDKPILAVMEVEDKTGKFKKGDLEAATEYLSTLLITSGKYSVVEKGRQEAKKKQVVKDLKRETHDACYDDKCRIELGRALAADTLLVCSIIGMGNTCTLTCRMVPLEKEVADKAGMAEFECGVEALVGAMKSTTAGLSGADSTDEASTGAGTYTTTVEAFGPSGLPAGKPDVLLPHPEPQSGSTESWGDGNESSPRHTFDSEPAEAGEKRSDSIFKTWWFWTAVGVATVGVGAALAYSLAAGSASAPTGTIHINRTPVD